MKNIITVFFLTVSSFCFTQGVELFKQSYILQPNVFSLYNSVLIPVPVKEQYVLAGYSNELHRHSFESINKFIGHKWLFGTLLKLGDMKQHNLTLLGMVNLNTIENNSAREVRPSGLLLYRNKNKSGFSFVSGLYYSHEFFGHFFVPAVGFTLKKNRLKLDALVPIKGSVNLAWGEGNTLGLAFLGRIKSFSTTLFSGAYMHSVENNVSSFVEFNLFKPLFLRFDAGAVLGRQYDYYSFEDQLNLGVSIIKIGQRQQPFNEKVMQSVPFLSATLSLKVSEKK